MICAFFRCDLSDLGAIKSVEDECFDQPYSTEIIEKMLENPRSFVIKAEQNDGKILGYIAIETAFDEAELIKIAIKKEFRKCQIASNLLDFALKMLENEVKKLFLEVNEGNLPAISFYKKHGFSTIGLRKKYYGDSAAILMQKTVN